MALQKSTKPRLSIHELAEQKIGEVSKDDLIRYANKEFAEAHEREHAKSESVYKFITERMHEDYVEGLIDSLIDFLQEKRRTEKEKKHEKK